MQKYFVLALIEHDFHISGSKLRSKLVGHFTTYLDTRTPLIPSEISRGNARAWVSIDFK